MRARAAILLTSLAAVTLGAKTPAAPQQTPPQTPAPAQAPAPATPPTVSTVPSCPELATALTTLTRNDVRLRDWPQLARYREQNRQLPPPAADEPRVVFMGDSITDAWPQPRFGDFFVGKPYVGRGISGQTTPQMLIRFRPDVLDLKPKVVVILAGTNDIAGNTGPMTDEEIEGNIASMAELAKLHGVRVVLSSILPVSAYHVAANGVPQTTLRPMARIRAINDWMKKYAADEKHVYLDYFPGMIDATGHLRAELSGDDLHPNAQGYAIMGPLAEAAIKQAVR
jgi:lysophospholipase L1-like esterase